jgi:hypothetical protein
MSILAAVFLAGSVTFAQTAADMATLERRVEDAQAAYDRAQTTGDDVELREIQDDLAYLRVKARRGMTVTNTERRELGERIDRFMTRISTRSANSGVRARPQRGNRDGAMTGRNGRELPAGTEVDVRLVTRLDSKTAQLEDKVEASTMVDLYQGDRLLVPAGSIIEGYVSSVDRASRTDRKGEITVMFTKLTVNGRVHDVRAYVTQALESQGIKGEAERIGAGAGIGAIIGGILGGVKGAITGILIGGGGVIAATEGKDVELEPGTVLRVRFDTPVSLAY